jgi:hypothetical protein
MQQRYYKQKQRHRVRQDIYYTLQHKLSRCSLLTKEISIGRNDRGLVNCTLPYTVNCRLQYTVNCILPYKVKCTLSHTVNCTLPYKFISIFHIQLTALYHIELTAL